MYFCLSLKFTINKRFCFLFFFFFFLFNVEQLPFPFKCTWDLPTPHEVVKTAGYFVLLKYQSTYIPVKIIMVLFSLVLCCNCYRFDSSCLRSWQCCYKSSVRITENIVAHQKKNLHFVLYFDENLYIFDY